jgi:AcrR family transcriptional regulator
MNAPALKQSRQQQKSETRQRLIEAGLKLFAERGIMATTTAEIARASGAAHGTVFLHFVTRDDLVVAVMDEFARRLQEEFDRIRQWASLADALQAHLRALEEFEPFYARLVAESGLLPPSVTGSLFALQAGISNRLFRAAAEEQRAGLIRPLPQPLFFNTWISLVHYYLAHRELFAPGQSVIRAKGQELREHFLSLLRP